MVRWYLNVDCPLAEVKVEIKTMQQLIQPLSFMVFVTFSIWSKKKHQLDGRKNMLITLGRGEKTIAPTLNV